MNAATQQMGRPCKRGHSGLRWKANNSCVECVREKGRSVKSKAYQAKWARDNPQCRQNWRANNPRKVMLIRARERATKQGVDFCLVEKDICIPKICPVLGIKLDGGSRDSAPQIDRLVPAKGYIPGNICVISGRANRIKSDASLKELVALVKYVKTHG